MKKLLEILNLKVVDARKDKSCEYILFDDLQTFIILSEQDDYTYHDCSSSAREIEIIKSREMYKDILFLQRR